MKYLVQAYVSNMTGHPPEESIDLVHRAMRLSPRDSAEWLFYDVLSGGYFNAGRFAEGLAAGRRLVALWPASYFGYLWGAMNAVEHGQIEATLASIVEASAPGLARGVARYGAPCQRRDGAGTSTGAGWAPCGKRGWNRPRLLGDAYFTIRS